MPAGFRARSIHLAIAVLLFQGVGISTLQAREAPQSTIKLLNGSGNVTPPVRVSSAPPAYTELASTAGLQGSVTVRTVIDEQGKVTAAQVLEGLPLGLDQSALDAVKTWRFKPAKQKGRPVKIYYTLTVNFQVERATTIGPVFKRFLGKNPDFAELMRGRRYAAVGKFLDRRAAKQPEDSEIRLARSYLFLEQGRLSDAWQEALAYQGPDSYEILYRIGAVAWSRAFNQQIATEKARAELVELGLQAETRAIAGRADAFEALVYKILLLQAKMKLSDPTERQALHEEAIQLRKRAVDLQSRSGAQGAIPEIESLGTR